MVNHTIAGEAPAGRGLRARRKTSRSTQGEFGSVIVDAPVIVDVNVNAIATVEVIDPR